MRYVAEQLHDLLGLPPELASASGAVVKFAPHLVTESSSADSDVKTSEPGGVPLKPGASPLAMLERIEFLERQGSRKTSVTVSAEVDMSKGHVQKLVKPLRDAKKPLALPGGSLPWHPSKRSGRL
jgi:hypothetical protein